MARVNILDLITSHEWLESLIPDFVLAFALFTSLIYAVLGRRMGHQRSAIIAAAAIGLALSAGLVTWEQYNILSITDLGPLAVGFAIIVLAGVMYQAIRGIGGSWAGAGIAFGACLLVGWTLGIDWPVDPQVVQTVMGVTLTFGVIAFLFYRHGHNVSFHSPPREFTEIRHDVSDVEKDRWVSRRVTGGLRSIRDQAASLWQQPSGADDVMRQLKLILPAEGWLTQRMSRLRARAVLMKKGHVARIEELRKHVHGLPTKAKVRVSRELQSRYRELRFDERIERLDKLVASNERAVRELTREAQRHLATHEFRELTEVLAAAEKTQARCSRLFKHIDRTEKKLLATAKRAAKQTHEVSHA